MTHALSHSMHSSCSSHYTYCMLHNTTRFVKIWTKCFSNIKSKNPIWGVLHVYFFPSLNQRTLAWWASSSSTWFSTLSIKLTKRVLLTLCSYLTSDLMASLGIIFVIFSYHHSKIDIIVSPLRHQNVFAHQLKKLSFDDLPMFHLSPNCLYQFSIMCTMSIIDQILHKPQELSKLVLLIPKSNVQTLLTTGQACHFAYIHVKIPEFAFIACSR